MGTALQLRARPWARPVPSEKAAAGHASGIPLRTRAATGRPGLRGPRSLGRSIGGVAVTKLAIRPSGVEGARTARNLRFHDLQKFGFADGYAVAGPGR